MAYAAGSHHAIKDAFLDLAGEEVWLQRLSDISEAARRRSFSARALQQRHALELALARIFGGEAQASLGRQGSAATEARALDFAREAVELAATLPSGPRDRLRHLLAAGLTGQANLIPLFHMLRVASLQRSRGFTVHHAGLIDGTPHDLLIRRDEAEAEIVCETALADEGRPLHHSGWCTLVDRVNPDLHTWLSAHPGRYVLKVTLPDGIQEPEHVSELHRRIAALLSSRKRQDADQAAVLKLDPLLIAGAQAGLPAALRAQFGPDTHLAMAGNPGSDSILVLAARSGRENGIAAAVCRRATLAASRLSGTRPGILAMFLEDLNRTEWRSLRESLDLEGAVRRFLTSPLARHVVAVSCASRMEMFGMVPPDATPGGELRFRHPSHPQGRLSALLPSVESCG
ncbi:Hypothetical protein RADP37_01888 [Roseomonas mucosa]|uniref:Uncharacterized protein n=1 Tax=Roseomonas mucosa TaxID=207340 RepID=A0A4Y1MY56_9PROT|nr:Hypothetical protein RADP37_01888 [Roseomonas mucosa]